MNTYAWDARNRLVALTGPVPGTFVYDALGRRSEKTINAATTTILHDGLNPVQLGGQANVTNLLTGLSIDEYLALTTGADTSGFVSDALGSTAALTDATGTPETEYTYEPFGMVSATGSSSENPFVFTGREDDGTSLYHYRARYYHPGLQRFISEDPIGLAGGDTNLYAYVFNAPTEFRDPSGLAVEPVSWAALAIFCGGGAIANVGAKYLSGRGSTFSDFASAAAVGCGVGAVTLTAGIAAGLTAIAAKITSPGSAGRHERAGAISSDVVPRRSAAAA